MLVPVSIQDFAPGAIFPPDRVADRTNRLELYENLYRGDISDFVKDMTAANFVPNFWERVLSVIVSLMMAADPEVSDEDLLTVQALLGDGAINGFRSGRGYMIRAGDEMWSPETSCVYEGTNEDIFTICLGTSINTPDNSPDYADIYNVGPDFAIYWQQRWDHGSLREVIVEPTMMPGTFAAVDRPPRYRGFGKSLFDSLIAPVVAMSLRLSGNERVIEKNLHPVTMMPVALADFSAFGGQGDPLNRQTNRPNLAEFQREVNDALDEDTMLVPDGATNITKLEWGATAMSAAMEMVDKVTTMVSIMSGVPIDVLNGEFAATSGVALDRMLLALASEVRMFKRVLHAGAEKVYGQPFDWDDYFSSGQTDADTNPQVDDPAPETVIMVPSESEAPGAIEAV